MTIRRATCKPHEVKATIPSLSTDPYSVFPGHRLGTSSTQYAKAVVVLDCDDHQASHLPHEIKATIATLVGPFFAKYDSDKSGYIDVHELQWCGGDDGGDDDDDEEEEEEEDGDDDDATHLPSLSVLQELGEPSQPDEVRGLLAQYDVNHDNILDFHEFCLLVTDLTVQSFKQSRHPKDNKNPAVRDDHDTYRLAPSVAMKLSLVTGCCIHIIHIHETP
jgi:hypothetical protein